MIKATFHRDELKQQNTHVNGIFETKKLHLIKHLYNGNNTKNTQMIGNSTCDDHIF